MGKGLKTESSHNARRDACKYVRLWICSHLDIFLRWECRRWARKLFELVRDQGSYELSQLQRRSGELQSQDTAHVLAHQLWEVLNDEKTHQLMQGGSYTLLIPA